MKWPIEYLFVGMKIKDYHAATNAATRSEHLDKWHTFHQVNRSTYNTTGQAVQQESALLADPAQVLGVDAAGNLTTAAGAALLAQDLNTGDVLRIDGNTFTVVVGDVAGNSVDATTGVQVTVSPVPAVALANAARTSAVVSYQGLQVEADECVRTMDSLTIKAHGIDIYKDFPMGFFNSYTSYHFGGPNINTPEDCGFNCKATVIAKSMASTILITILCNTFKLREQLDLLTTKLIQQCISGVWETIQYSNNVNKEPIRMQGTEYII